MHPQERVSPKPVVHVVLIISMEYFVPHPRHSSLLDVRGVRLLGICFVDLTQAHQGFFTDFELQIRESATWVQT